ncbi:MAG TPA: putative sulfate exporter family transporter, partial [Verrucomicrobiae bacterium]|nr:putative sulfate exporter family transporter [Verrucomicrobiae bacterium]
METKATGANPEYAWAEYLHCMEGTPDEGSLPVSKPTAISPIPGLLLCLGLTLLSYWTVTLPVWPFVINGRHPIEPVTIVIVLGMITANCLPISKQFQPGIKFSVKKLLTWGIVLLGARLDFRQILNLGAVGVAMSCFEVILAVIIMLLLTRWFKLSGKLGTLLGIGTAICGGTAVVAAAPVIEADEADVVFAVATVTLLGLVAMFLLPVFGHLLALSNKAFGIWAGLTIHQLPQVVAAGFTYSPEAEEHAIVIKLARICLLAPLVFIVGLVYARYKTRQHLDYSHGRINYFSMFPKFIFGFLALAFLRGQGWLPDVSVHFPADKAVAANTPARLYSL